MSTDHGEKYFGYEIKDGNKQVLGSGHRGHTYLGWIRRDTDPESVRAALKCFDSGLQHANGESKKAFEREIMLFSGLRHRNIVRYLALVYDAGLPVICSEYVKGATLEDILSARQLIGRVDSRDWSLRLFRWFHQLAGALEYLKRQGGIHRDVKPRNVVIRQLDDCPVLIDFGIGKLRNKPAGNAGATTISGGKFIGTPRFAAPEQFGAGEAVNELADIYALGATLAYLFNPECLPEMHHESIGDSGYNHESRRPELEKLPDIPGLRDLVDAMTCLDPVSRPPACDVKDRLAEILWDGFQSQPPPDGDTIGEAESPAAWNRPGDLPQFIQLRDGIEIARTRLSYYAFLVYSDRQINHLNLEAPNRPARVSYRAAEKLLEVINSARPNRDCVYRLATQSEWMDAAAGLDDESPDEEATGTGLFSDGFREMEWLPPRRISGPPSGNAARWSG